jgi:hypothetical protein
MDAIKKWFLGLWFLLSDTQGKEGETETETEEETETDTETETETETDTETEENTEEEEGDDADADSGKDGGKERSKFIPRDRFDKVNAKAQKVEKLIELGILAEGEDGELHINPEALKKPKQEESDTGKAVNFRFSKDEVDDKSWPLVEKINKAYDHYDKQVNQVGFALTRIFSELNTLREFPESIAKDSPLKKKALEILKSDDEFKRSHRGDPEAIYWAFKRAADILAGKNPQKPNLKKKGSFIVGKGDTGGKSGKQPVDKSKWTQEDWDKAEKEEAKRLTEIKK